MQRIFLVKNDELDEINDLLAKGAIIKSVHPVAENLDIKAQNHHYLNDYLFKGDIYAYVVVEFA